MLAHARPVLLCLAAFWAMTPATAAEKAASDDKDVKALADVIDRHIAARWKEKDVRPAEPTSAPG